jgi:hypothetical protein
MKYFYLVGFLGALLNPSVSNARGWRWRDLDPFNRDSAIRRAGRNIDPGVKLGHIKTRIISRVGLAVADNPTFQSKAETNGWTLETCRFSGAALGTLLTGFYSAPICAAMTVGEPLSTGGCIGLVSGSSAFVTHVACTHLCDRQKLRGC